MSELGGAFRFQQLSVDEQAAYIEHAKKMTTFARDHAVPIVIAPPVGVEGEINNGTGFVLRLGFEFFVVTASHVLEKYEKRQGTGERVYWQVGKLPPFDPLPCIAWRDKKRDVLLLRISRDQERDIGPCIRSSPSKWPPAIPQEGQLVLVAGFPGALRQVDSAGTIGAGPYSALFRVGSVGDGYCKCSIEQKDLISFGDAPVPPPGTKIGGVSGGPVFLVGQDYPIAGVVKEDWYLDAAELQLLEFATLEGVELEAAPIL